MRAALPHVVLLFFPPRSTLYLQPCDVAVFRSFKSCIQAQASATLARTVLDGSFEGLAMKKAWRRQSSADWTVHRATPNSTRPLKRPTSCTPLALCSRDRWSWSPLPKTPWTWPWQRRQTTRTTRPCQTRRPSLRSSSTCPRLRHLHARCRTSLCACCTALDRVDVSQKNCHLHIISHRALCCFTCPLSRVWCLSVFSRVRCPVCLCPVCPAQAPRQ